MITNEEIMDVMRAVLKTDVDENTSQNNCEKWDSMNHLNLVIELEDTFEVELEPNEISLMKSFSDIKNNYFKQVTIRTIMGKTFIIAEMSANHNGSKQIGIETIRAAKRAGADAIKLQTYTADTITLDND